MSPEKQRIAIAEYCGWTSIGMLNGNPDQPAGFPPGANTRPESLPRYLNDWNAMREAVSSLSPVEKRRFLSHLELITENPDASPWFEVRIIDATLEEYAKALLRIIGKWEES